MWVNKAEIEAMAAAVGLSVEEFERRYVRMVGIRKSLIECGQRRLRLSSTVRARSCQVYDVRPRQCRTWPFWPSNLASPEAWVATGERCRGCNGGRLVPVGKILAELETVRV